MEHNFPAPINGESDLKFYEDYINKCGCENKPSAPADSNETDKYEMLIENKSANLKKLQCKTGDTDYMQDFLKTVKGKLVRVESLIGGCLEARIGTLIGAGADYIVLKLYQSCSTMICEMSSVKYITVIHDNDYNKMRMF